MDDMVTCPECREEVAESEICEEHGVCPWCDDICKLDTSWVDED